jgi:alkylated DNA repair dioxygenase AlkB
MRTRQKAQAELFQFERNVLSEEETKELWRQFPRQSFHTVPIRGRTFRRLMKWMSEETKEGKRPHYTFTGSKGMPPQEDMAPFLYRLQELVYRKYGIQCNQAFVTYYGDENTRIGMHKDNHDDDFFVFSLGNTRVIEVGPVRKWNHPDNYKIPLENGSLLRVTKKGNERFWHGINYADEPTGPRISIVFRRIQEYQ